MANSSSCVAFREYYCLVPTRVLWSFLCFLGQKKTRKAHHYFSKKNRETKARHIYSPIYIYILPTCLFTFLYSPNEYPFVSQHGFFSKLAFDHHSFSGGACWCCCSLLKWRMQGWLQPTASAWSFFSVCFLFFWFLI